MKEHRNFAEQLSYLDSLIPKEQYQTQSRERFDNLVQKYIHTLDMKIAIELERRPEMSTSAKKRSRKRVQRYNLVRSKVLLLLKGKKFNVSSFLDSSEEKTTSPDVESRIRLQERGRI